MLTEQLTIPGTPKRRGGRRLGAGRPKTAPETKMIRVCAAAAEACKKLDEHYRQMLSIDDSERIVLLTKLLDDFLCSPSDTL
jgi:hypothetical protein